MSLTYTFNWPSGFEREATENLQRLETAKVVLGREANNQLREHFRLRNLGGPRNALGAPSSNFWSDVRDSVQDAEVSGDTVRIQIGHEAIAQKIFGGTITNDGKKLAIPARTEAYGRSPRVWGDKLDLLVFRSGATALADKAGAVFYWLVDSVTQRPDPQALPSDATMITALDARLERHLNRNTN